VQVNGGYLSPEQFVQVTSTEAAKIFSIYPRKGLIASGSDADVIIFDPAVEHVISASKHHSRMDTNVYEGFRCRGKVCRLTPLSLQFSALSHREVQAMQLCPHRPLRKHVELLKWLFDG
jgi:hypothetical protein